MFLKIDRGIPLVTVADFAAASAAVRHHIDSKGLASSEWSGGQLYDGKAVIGHVSYNGRVWPPTEWTADQQPIYDPIPEHAGMGK